MGVIVAPFAVNDQHISQPFLLRLNHKGKQHLSAFFDRLAQQIEACLLAVLAAAELLQHAALQTFALEFQGGCQRHDIEITGGQEIIKLQGVNPLHGAGLTLGMPVNIVMTFQRLNVLHGAKK